jgi:VWFA-related protein
MRRSLLLLACGLWAAVLTLEARQNPSQPLFRASTDLVDVDVSVLDGDRLPVRGLTASDFTVLEDGRARPIVAFSAVDLPPRERPTARWMSTVAPDVVDNDLQHEGRLVVILIDQSIAFEDLPVSQRFADAVVDQLRPGDLAAVAYSTFGIPQNFTEERERLRAAIRRPMVGLPADDGGGASLCPCGVCSLEAIGNIAEAMAPVRQRRKMLLVIGSNIAMQSAGACSAQINPARERAFRAVEAGNVTVYAFDPAGLPTLSTSASERRQSSARGGGAAMRNMVRVGNLRTLPDRTGGRYLYDPLRPADRVAEIFRESESYYVLGFEPAHPDEDGRFHGIRVRVNRPGVTLQARRGYYGGAVGRPEGRGPEDALRAGLSAVSGGLRAAVSGLWPRSDVVLRVSAVPVAAPDLTRASVAAIVHVTQTFDAPGTPLLGSPADAAPIVVNVLTGAFDRQGRALASANQSVRVTPQLMGPRVFGYEVVSQLELKPGRYELRTAVEDTRLGRSGSVYTYVDVPDYQRAPVALSGLLISVRPGTAVAPDAPLAGLMPVTPTTRREFVASDDVTAFVRLYQGVSRALMPGYIVAEILDEQDTSVYRQETRLASGAFGASRAVDFSVDVPVDRLAPGHYVLGVEARHGNETARRDVRFSVRP